MNGYLNRRRNLCDLAYHRITALQHHCLRGANVPIKAGGKRLLIVANAASGPRDLVTSCGAAKTRPPPALIALVITGS
jgi:hypothetical protein